jgi:DNA-binding transcriptional ArsR family regulator
MSTESTTSTDRIEKQVLLRAPRSRVWQALTDSQAFGEWFGVKLTDTFTPGARVRGAITHPSWEHVPFEITIERMEPERLFSWRWHPHTIEPETDYAAEPTTLVVFELAWKPTGATRRAGSGRCSRSRSMSAGPPEPWEGGARLADVAPVFAALGDEMRLRLVARLCADGPQSIAHLTAGTSVTRQAVTKHLRVLAEAGLARSSRLGRESIWELEPQKLEEVRRCLDHISAQWDEALGRLKAFVEDPREAGHCSGSSSRGPETFCRDGLPR